jgi:hypothetical protein
MAVGGPPVTTRPPATAAATAFSDTIYLFSRAAAGPPAESFIIRSQITRCDSAASIATLSQNLSITDSLNSTLPQIKAGQSGPLLEIFAVLRDFRRQRLLPSSRHLSRRPIKRRRVSPGRR